MQTNPNATTAAAAQRAAAANATATEAAEAAERAERALQALAAADPTGAIAALAAENAAIREHLTAGNIEREEFYNHRRVIWDADMNHGYQFPTPYLPATAAYNAGEAKNSATAESEALTNLLQALRIIRKLRTEAYHSNPFEVANDADRTLSHAAQSLRSQIKRLVLEQDWLMDWLITDAIDTRKEAR